MIKTLGVKLFVWLFLVAQILAPAQRLKAEIPNLSPTAVNCNVGNIQCRKGILSQNETWTSDKIYVLTDDLSVPVTVTLSVSPGTIIKADISADFIISGTLNVSGTAEQPVYITSVKDDSVGGDINNDGSSTQPVADDWDNIQFLGGSGRLDFVEIRYAGGDPTESPADGAIYLSGSSPILNNVVVKNAKRSAISASPTDNPTITNFVASNTPFAGLEIRPGSLSSEATWATNGISYILDDDLTIAPGAKLTLLPGVVVKLDTTADINVNGIFNIGGTKEKPVVITSLKDDSVVGDTNSDGNKSTPAIDDWDSINFLSGSAGLLSFVDISYSGGDLGAGAENRNGAIFAQNSLLTISNCLLYNNHIGVYNAGDSTTLTINSCDIYNNKEYGVYNKSITNVINGSNNWWGSNQGPNDQSSVDGITNLSTRGEKVSDFVAYSPWSQLRTQSTLKLNPNKLTFTGTAGVTSPGAVALNIQNASNGQLDWTIAENISWLSVDASSGKTPAVAMISVNTAGLNAGAYLGNIIISGSSARFSPQIIPIQLTVVNSVDANPQIKVSANVLEFNVAFAGREDGVNPLPQLLTIMNGGTGTLNWQATESIPWLTLDKTTGTAQSIVSASVNITGLNEGSYRGDISITSAEAKNSPATVKVWLVMGCASITAVDVVLVIDRSYSMAAPDISTFQNTKLAAKLFIDQLNFSQDQLGLVTFYGVGVLESTLSKEQAITKQIVDELNVDDGNNSQSGTNIADAILTAQRELFSNRRSPTSRPLIILLSDGEANKGGDPIVAANATKAKGVHIVTIGLGNANQDVLRSIASTPADFYLAPASADLLEIYNRIAVNIGCSYKTFLPTVQK